MNGVSYIRAANSTIASKVGLTSDILASGKTVLGVSGSLSSLKFPSSGSSYKTLSSEYISNFTSNSIPSDTKLILFKSYSFSSTNDSWLAFYYFNEDALVYLKLLESEWSFTTIYNFRATYTSSSNYYTMGDTVSGKAMIYFANDT